LAKIAGTKRLLAMNIDKNLDVFPSGSSFPLCMKVLGFNLGIIGNSSNS
jgi:hypothetical protein